MVGSVGLLTVDCGNTTTDCLSHGDGARLRFGTGDVDLAALEAFVYAHAIQRCVAASVVGNGIADVAAVLKRAAVSVLFAGRDLPCPLRLDYETPATLGVDRWLGALAAYRRHGRSLVVDCGSATTVNLVDADGVFRGGPIAPGLRAFAAGMASVTPELPKAQLDALPHVPPRSSQAAVDTGVLLGYAGLVERLVGTMLRLANGPTTVVITGGNAERLRGHSRLRAIVDRDLVHHGLRHLADGSS